MIGSRHSVIDDQRQWLAPVALSADHVLTAKNVLRLKDIFPFFNELPVVYRLITFEALRHIHPGSAPQHVYEGGGRFVDHTVTRCPHLKGEVGVLIECGGKASVKTPQLIEQRPTNANARTRTIVNVAGILVP